jgi:hypothetical protein
MQCDGELMQVVAALGAGRGLADFLHSWDEQADQDGDDRNHDQQLDQRERGTTTQHDPIPQ